MLLSFALASFKIDLISFSSSGFSAQKNKHNLEGLIRSSTKPVECVATWPRLPKLICIFFLMLSKTCTF